MIETLMERLIKRALASTVGTTLNKEIAQFFGLSDGKVNLPVKSIEKGGPSCLHTVMIPIQDGKDILISCARENSKYFYLTDESGALRAAAISTSSRPSLALVSNEQVNDEYKGHFNSTSLFSCSTACPTTMTIIGRAKRVASSTRGRTVKRSLPNF
jgi:hypothetical protein